ncbi:3-phosphoshikimate 1-carboxyvinyltransferase [Hyphococcus lacteus]|uniref:3-phosphoshikimate 1-carboxyvinyltransferase n=1 Tax=Hyphococcus lacteus TaxID=3143536 RepID=A0ABV3Z2A1_9PROT
MSASSRKPSDTETHRTVARRSGPLNGAVTAPGDKSISHRSLILSALAKGESRITGLLEGDDVLRTATSMRALGASVERSGAGEWTVSGGAWATPEKSLYFGNSGTGVRLVMGAVAGAGVGASFEGDISLRGRPMGRVLEPLRLMGVEADDHEGRLPVKIKTAENGLRAVEVKLASASAQVKSAILLAALGASGQVRIHEPILCRDHTERMLSAFGVELSTEPDCENGRYITMAGGQALSPCDVNVPGDPSSAAFAIAAALIVPNSDVVVKGVLLNPLRTGLYQTLREMGADLTFENQREENGEEVADIRARYSVLRGVEVPASRAPSMIDEYPILAVVAAFAHGETMMTGLEELRVKESDRIASVETGLVACGVDVVSGPDWLRVRGGSTTPAMIGGATIKTHHDHRIAMSFLVAGLVSEQPIQIDDASMIATSFPDFIAQMISIGADIAQDK